MGGATNRLFSLLTTATSTSSSSSAAAVAFPLLFHHHRHCCSSLLLLLRRRFRPPPLSPSRLFLFSPSAISPRRFHSHALPDHPHSPSLSPPSAAVCPEWSDLFHALSAASYFDRATGLRDGDEFACSPQFTDEFRRSARACLEFARERAGLVRLLSRRDVEVVIGNGTPFRFREAEDFAAKLRTSLFNGESNVSDRRELEIVIVVLSFLLQVIHYIVWIGWYNRTRAGLLRL